MTKEEEIQINATFKALTQQRDIALNQVVLMAGLIASLEDQIKSLTPKEESDVSD